eukprot:TRINITY_DN21544_c0_g1_i1.p1 TRINITY_DN21544_c0_g1~~TRINITY_DN21544_c0_g1_i1.p1  ORF type:complete len:515 (-),score=39.75 TRINITY_DN21544_c0_g1_i1:157-1701(-)
MVTLQELEERRRHLAAEVESMRRAGGESAKPVLSSASRSLLRSPLRSPRSFELEPSVLTPQVSSLAHTDLIARARAVERETAGAIDRSRAGRPDAFVSRAVVGPPWREQDTFAHAYAQAAQHQVSHVSNEASNARNDYAATFADHSGGAGAGRSLGYPTRRSLGAVFHEPARVYGSMRDHRSVSMDTPRRMSIASRQDSPWGVTSSLAGSSLWQAGSSTSKPLQRSPSPRPRSPLEQNMPSATDAWCGSPARPRSSLQHNQPSGRNTLYGMSSPSPRPALQQQMPCGLSALSPRSALQQKDAYTINGTASTAAYPPSPEQQSRREPLTGNGTFGSAMIGGSTRSGSCAPSRCASESSLRRERVSFEDGWNGRTVDVGGGHDRYAGLSIGPTGGYSSVSYRSSASRASPGWSSGRSARSPQTSASPAPALPVSWVSSTPSVAIRGAQRVTMLGGGSDDGFRYTTSPGHITATASPGLLASAYSASCGSSALLSSASAYSPLAVTNASGGWRRGGW